MSTVNGVTVFVKIDGVVIGGQTSASIARTADTLETTCKSSFGYREFSNSWKSWTVDMDAFVCTDDAGQADLQAAYEGGDVVEVTIEVGTSTEVGKGYEYLGNAYITDLSEEYGQDDAVTFTMSLQGTGVLNKYDTTNPKPV